MSEKLHLPSIIIDSDTSTSLPTGEFLIEDQRVHEILAKLGGILHAQIADAGTFFARGGGKDHRLARTMDEDELAVWDTNFEIRQIADDAVKSRSLVMVDIDAAETALANPSENTSLVVDQKHKSLGSAGLGSKNDSVRVNYGEERYLIPRDLITPLNNIDDLEFQVKPSIHFGGRGGSKGHLYNGILGLHTYLMAPNGTQLVAKIANSDTWNNPPVYNPRTLIDTSMWTNTSIDENEPNSLSVATDSGKMLTLRAYLHDLSTIDQIEIPKSDKLRAWLWQIDKCMTDEFISLAGSPVGEIEA